MPSNIIATKGFQCAPPTRQCLVCECKEDPNRNLVDTGKAWLCNDCRTALKRFVRSPLKTKEVCKSCKWDFYHECEIQENCDTCPHTLDSGACKCGMIHEGAPCPYYEKQEEPTNE